MTNVLLHQRKVFDDIGKDILDRAWKGYDSTVLTYGQVGSGKSWTVFGYGANRGLLPMICEALFDGIEKQSFSGIIFECKFSMLEIFNEVARDLLDGKPGEKKSSLKIREHPTKGFYGKG